MDSAEYIDTNARLLNAAGSRRGLESLAESLDTAAAATSGQRAKDLRWFASVAARQAEMIRARAGR